MSFCPKGSLRETERSEVNAEDISQRDRFATFGRSYVNSALRMHGSVSWILRYDQDASTIHFEAPSIQIRTLLRFRSP